MLTGKVKHFNTEKGFGFIENAGGNDIFVHESALKNCKFLKKGVSVRFTVGSTNKGLEASNVELVRDQTYGQPHRFTPPHHSQHRY